jgi:hypothetical protein
MSLMSSLSRHAAVRLQQRCIPRAIVEAVLDWGDRRSAGAGASSYAFSKRSWASFARHVGAEAERLKRYRNVYVVVARDGTIITVCWRAPAARTRGGYEVRSPLSAWAEAA